jgi:hypothetical protein
MNKWVTLLLTAIIIGGALFLLVLPRDYTGRAVLVPPVPKDCSNESIKAVWSSIFRVSPNDLVTRTAISQESKNCNSFIAYKIAGNELNILVGYIFENGTVKTMKYSAGHGNFADEAIENIKKINELDPEIDYSLLALGSLSTTHINPRPSFSTYDPSSIFINSFKIIPPSNWSQDPAFPVRDYFRIEEKTNDTTSINAGSIMMNYSLETAYIFEYIPISSCLPHWSCTEWEPKDCYIGENQTRKCTDTSLCPMELNKPIESQACVSGKEKSFPMEYLAIIAAGIFALILAITLIIVTANKKGDNKQKEQQKLDSQYKDKPNSQLR